MGLEKYFLYRIYPLVFLDCILKTDVFIETISANRLFFPGMSDCGNG